MTTRTSHPAFIPLQGGINFRDLGGQRAADGRRVRSGKLLRSGSLHNMTPEDLNHLSAIPLSRVLDYRDPTEVNRSPDRLNSEAFYLNAPANPLSSSVNAKVTEFNAATLNAMDGEQFMLQHCAVGKDRTGVGCALTLFALGCDSNTVMEEYLLTQGMLAQVEGFLLDTFGEGLNELGRKNLAAIMTVQESYLATALSSIEQRYGNVDRWLEQEYRLTPQAREALQSRLLED
ncbi:TPA: tyrosine-protein phosphatase [Klebsiella aerogenes]|nr:tyrosine-protein phosphatase [Klebsiella aerogenes]